MGLPKNSLTDAPSASARELWPVNAGPRRLLPQHRRYAHALGNYEQAIQQQPDDIVGYSNRGLVRFYRGDFAKAADDFKRVTDRQPDNAYSI